MLTIDPTACYLYLLQKIGLVNSDIAGTADDTSDIDDTDNVLYAALLSLAFI